MVGHRQHHLLLLEVTREKYSELGSSSGKKKGSVARSSRYFWQLVGLSDHSLVCLTTPWFVLPLLGLSNHSFFSLTIVMDMLVAISYSALDEDCIQRGELVLYNANWAWCSKHSWSNVYVVAPPWQVNCWVWSDRQGYLHVFMCCGYSLTGDLLSAVWLAGLVARVHVLWLLPNWQPAKCGLFFSTILKCLFDLW